MPFFLILLKSLFYSKQIIIDLSRYIIHNPTPSHTSFLRAKQIYHYHRSTNLRFLLDKGQKLNPFF